MKVILCIFSQDFKALWKSLYKHLWVFFRIVRHCPRTNHDTSYNTNPNRNTSLSLLALVTISSIYDTTFVPIIRTIKLCTTFICEQNFRKTHVHIYLCPIQMHLYVYLCQLRLCYWSPWCPDFFQKMIASTWRHCCFSNAPEIFSTGQGWLFTASRFKLIGRLMYLRNSCNRSFNSLVISLYLPIILDISNVYLPLESSDIISFSEEGSSHICDP